MITTFGDKAPARIFEGKYVHSLPLHMQALARRKLLMMDTADSVHSLHAPPGNRLKALQGQRNRQWSIRINAQRRICFHFGDEEALNVEIVDYH
jgi:proteic killer suppression protein